MRMMFCYEKRIGSEDPKTGERQYKYNDESIDIDDFWIDCFAKRVDDVIEKRKLARREAIKEEVRGGMGALVCCAGVGAAAYWITKGAIKAAQIYAHRIRTR